MCSLNKKLSVIPPPPPPPPPTHTHTQTMDTLHDDNELVFLYQLVRGQTGSSYACKVAAAMGMDESIVQRGAEVRTARSALSLQQYIYKGGTLVFLSLDH